MLVEKLIINDETQLNKGNCGKSKANCTVHTDSSKRLYLVLHLLLLFSFIQGLRTRWILKKD